VYCLYGILFITSKTFMLPWSTELLPASRKTTRGCSSTSSFGLIWTLVRASANSDGI
jgi:hypothetical protein